MHYQDLIIMRHAKSDWAVGEQSDIARPLNARGRRDAAKMGRWLRESEFAPTCVKSSSARRAAETAEIIAEALNGLPVICDDSLYLADLSDLLAIVRQPPASCWILIGHNPGLESLLHYCDPEIERRIKFSKLMPTAAICAFAVDMSDGTLARDCGTLLSHQRPKVVE